MSRIILLTGGRNYDDMGAVYTKLDAMHTEEPIGLIVHGACRGPRGLRGADAIAELWALSREVNYFGVPAKWAKYGRRAGPLRNEAMPLLCEQMKVPVDVVLACPGGDGTKGMVEIAERLRIPVEPLL